MRRRGFREDSHSIARAQRVLGPVSLAFEATDSTRGRIAMPQLGMAEVGAPVSASERSGGWVASSSAQKELGPEEVHIGRVGS